MERTWIWNGYWYVTDMDTDMDTGMDMDMDTDVDTDIDTDMDMDMDTDMEMDLDTETLAGVPRSCTEFHRCRCILKYSTVIRM